MSARAVRRVVAGICVVGIAGMIVSSIGDRTGAAMTFGLVTAVAILCLMVATSVTRDPAARAPLAGDDGDDPARRVEAGVAGLVAAGADEAALRALVRDAVALGRARRDR